MGDRNTLPVRLYVSVLLGTTTTTTTTTPTTTTPTCPSDYHWDPSIPFCHRITTNPKATWPDARTACQTVGADLAIIDVSAKFSKIFNDRKCLSERVFISSFLKCIFVSYISRRIDTVHTYMYDHLYLSEKRCLFRWLILSQLSLRSDFQ